MIVRWEKQRRFTVRVYSPRNRVGGIHYNLGIVAYSVAEAIEAAQRIHPEGCVQSVNDTGAIDYIVGGVTTKIEGEAVE